MRDDLAKYARPPLDDARLARQWSTIARARRTRPVALSVAFVAVGLLAVAIALVASRRLRAPVASTPSIATHVTELDSMGDHTTIVLADGSRIGFRPDSHVVLDESAPSVTHVSVTRGAADFDVKHDPTRSFVVTARGVTVVDTGTSFQVACVGDHDVRVTVREGSVRLERNDTPPSSLVAGDVWASGAMAALETSTATEPAVVDAGRHATAPASDDLLTRFSALAERDPNAAFDLVGAAGYPHAIERATPRQLFELGDAARLSGHPTLAASAFDALRTQHREDSRAGLAAMQLARLRQDTLGDLPGAEDALRDAIALAPTPAFREDAEARRVEVLDVMNDTARCQTARSEYLGRYPSGIHRARVEKHCAER